MAAQYPSEPVLRLTGSLHPSVYAIRIRLSRRGMLPRHAFSTHACIPPIIFSFLQSKAAPRAEELAGGVFPLFGETPIPCHHRKCPLADAVFLRAGVVNSPACQASAEWCEPLPLEKPAPDAHLHAELQGQRERESRDGRATPRYRACRHRKPPSPASLSVPRPLHTLTNFMGTS